MKIQAFANEKACSRIREEILYKKQKEWKPLVLNKNPLEMCHRNDCANHVETDLNTNHNFVKSHIVIEAHPHVYCVKDHRTNFKIKHIDICEKETEMNRDHDPQGEAEVEGLLPPELFLDLGDSYKRFSARDSFWQLFLNQFSKAVIVVVFDVFFAHERIVTLGL